MADGALSLKVWELGAGKPPLVLQEAANAAPPNSEGVAFGPGFFLAAPGENTTVPGGAPAGGAGAASGGAVGATGVQGSSRSGGAAGAAVNQAGIPSSPEAFGDSEPA